MRSEDVNALLPIVPINESVIAKLFDVRKCCINNRAKNMFFNLITGCVVYLNNEGDTIPPKGNMDILNITVSVGSISLSE